MAEATTLPVAGQPLAPTPTDVGAVEHGAVRFPPWRGEADRPEAPPPAPRPPAERVGFAVIGLGRLAIGQILPAFAACGLARPTALVSGSPEKARTVARQYGIPPEAVYGYNEIARLRENPAVAAGYVVTPNGLHRDQVLALAAAGKHVLCEKPMANTAAEARDMIAACAGARLRLMVAYRCQYEPYNRRVTALARSGEYGAVRLVEAVNVQAAGPVGQWRFEGPLAGGGALPDIGLYCLNGVRTVLGEEPVEVFASVRRPAGDARYAVLDETVAFLLRFPSGAIATCTTSYAAHEARQLRVRLERGSIELDNAFAYGGQRLTVAHRAGEAEAVEELRLSPADQFAREIDHFAACILEGRTPDTPGEEGLRDHVIMEAIYRSAATGAPVALG